MTGKPVLPINVALCFSLGEEDKLTLTGLSLLLPSQLAHRPGEGTRKAGHVDAAHSNTSAAYLTAGEWDGQAHPLLSSTLEGSNVWLGEPSGFLEKQGLPQPRDREQSRAPWGRRRMWKLYNLMCPNEDRSWWTSPRQEGFWTQGDRPTSGLSGSGERVIPGEARAGP